MCNKTAKLLGMGAQPVIRHDVDGEPHTGWRMGARDPFDPLNLPPGRDWANAEPTFSYGPPNSIGTRELLLDTPSIELPWDGLSAPPRASRWQQVGLVLGAGWDRLCKRKEASCAIVVAALILGAVALVLSGLSHVIGG